MAGNIQGIQETVRLSHADRIKRAQTSQGPFFTEKFDEILRQKQSGFSEGIRFSTHAQDRLRERNIVMTSEENLRLCNAVNLIQQKGGKESLVLLDDYAFVVSAPNRTVITAMDSSSIYENVFTNIDSAIII